MDETCYGCRGEGKVAKSHVLPVTERELKEFKTM
jgi:hypothetical protein